MYLAEFGVQYVECKGHVYCNCKCLKIKRLTYDFAPWWSEGELKVL